MNRADGVLRATDVKNCNLTPGYCFIGQQVSSAQEYWNGSIDDVRVYNRVLSDADIASLASAPAPYAGTPFGSNGAAWPLPGQIEAENYDSGGQNVACYDASAGNYGNGSYRSDDVDIRTSIDTGGRYQGGWTSIGEWLKYSVSVTATGHYTFQVRTASGVAGSGHLEVDGANVSGPIVLPNTGSWDTFTTVNVPGERPRCPSDGGAACDAVLRGRRLPGCQLVQLRADRTLAAAESQANGVNDTSVSAMGLRCYSFEEQKVQCQARIPSGL